MWVCSRADVTSRRFVTPRAGVRAAGDVPGSAVCVPVNSMLHFCDLNRQAFCKSCRLRNYFRLSRCSLFIKYDLCCMLCIVCDTPIVWQLRNLRILNACCVCNPCFFFYLFTCRCQCISKEIELTQPQSTN